MNDENVSRGTIAVAPERIVERGRGCWNCIHFVQGQPVLDKWMPETVTFVARVKLSGVMQLPEYEDAADALDVSKLMARGLPQEQAVVELARHKLVVARRLLRPDVQDVWEADKRIRDRRALTAAIEQGKLGMCSNNGVDREGLPVGTYVQCEHLCHKWSGRDGASLAYEGHTLDKLPDEVLDDAETIAAKRK